jgi:ankyrin repeat protein
MFGATPLHFASHAGHTEVVTALLSKGGNPSTLNMYGSPPLHYAIEKAHADVVAALLEHEDSNVNLPNMYGYSPLHLAASHGSVTITELLLAKGANQKIKNSVRSIIMISRVADLRSHVYPCVLHMSSLVIHLPSLQTVKATKEWHFSLNMELAKKLRQAGASFACRIVRLRLVASLILLVVFDKAFGPMAIRGSQNIFVRSLTDP